MDWLDHGGLLDRAVLSTRALRGAPDVRIEEMQARERIERLGTLRPLYGDPRLLDVPGGLHAPAAAIEPTLRPTRRGFELTWRSTHVPFNADVAGDFHRLDPANATASARLYGGDTPRPVVVALHGYGAGRPSLEPLVWPLRRWRRAGLDVVLPSLPFHGPRSSGGMAPPFPAADPRISHEGFRQAVVDVTGLIGWLRDRGHPRVSIVGMSLGGYVGALTATVLDDLHALGLVIPLASIALVARQHGRLGSGDAASDVQDAMEAIYLPSSPTARDPRIASDRVRILAARGDRITGMPHAELLAEHFQTDVVVCPGSHLVQAGLRWSEITKIL